MATFAWPICLCVTLLVFCLLFRNQIGHFIERTKRITKEGVEADSRTVNTQEVNDIAKPSPADELLKMFDNQLLVEQEGIIKGFLEQNRIQNAAERERVLVRHLASAYLVLRFESIYKLIWGSQLRALELLNENTPLGVLLPALESWYDLGKTLEPELYANYTFQQWYGFMESGPLIVNKAGTVHITVMGREFLKYLVQARYSLNKRG